MKATGVVRRIDDLGRVVIPKEIRRTLRIREGEPLEIFTDRDGEVILKKYIPINDLSLYAQEYVDVLAETLGVIAVIAEEDTIIAVAGGPKREFAGQRLGNIAEAIQQGQPTITSGSLTQNGKEFSSVVVAPIITDRIIGSVCLAPKKEETKMSQIEVNLANTAATFLAKQMQRN
ncbi:MAG: AbrB/MazE/SpoVT family DNA-binding domain-containing protein [Clostridia bacterium]|nr:AbrB/MazE/SpoVT family DNA-binding domain-containing protein [Clostridia bacterium]